MGGILYKNIGTGLLSSYKNQQRALARLNGVSFVERWEPDCNILQINTPWFYSLWVIRKARKHGQKIIIWSHVTAEDAMQVFWFNRFFFTPIKKYLTYAYKKADMVLCPSQHTKELLIGYGISKEKLVVHSNGVDTTEYVEDVKRRQSTRNKYGLTKLTVGTVGLVIPRKGTGIFVELAKEHQSEQFIWFGKIYSSLLAKALPKELPANVQFTNYVDDVVGAFNALDVFVFLSVEENQGMAILEAASVGLPILVRDLPAYRGWLIHDENCFIAKNDDEVRYYLDLLIKDKGLRERLGAKAYEMSLREDIDFLNKKLRKHYEELLAEK